MGARREFEPRLEYDRDGVLLYHWGAYAQAGTMGRDTWSGRLSLPHQLDVDENGTLYVASYSGGWVDKFTPKEGADAEKLVGRGCCSPGNLLIDPSKPKNSNLKSHLLRAPPAERPTLSVSLLAPRLLGEGTPDDAPTGSRASLPPSRIR